MSIDQLERSLDSLGGWLAFWTAVVAIGLVVEYGQSLWILFKATLRWLFRRAVFDRSLLNATAVGGLLITAGVAAEVWVEVRASQVETQLRNASNKALALLNKEANDARRDAATAMQRAAEAERETARLNEVAEAERLARVKLEERTALRDLTPAQFASVSKALTGFPGQGFEMVVFPVNFESNFIAGYVSGALTNAGWKGPAGIRLLPSPPDGMLVQGIYVQATSDAGSVAAARALFKALNDAEIAGVFDPAPLSNSDAPRVWVFVGDKPTPLRAWIK